MLCHEVNVADRDASTGGVGASRPLICSNLQKSWSKGSHAARELATVFCDLCF